MPGWLVSQFLKTFQVKDIKTIKMLNRVYLKYHNSLLNNN